MTPRRGAVIDIGSNSVKLLVADVAGSKVSPVFEAHETTRLSENLHSTSLLSSDAVDRTLRAVKKFYQLAQHHGAIKIQGYGTHALRESDNSQKILKFITQETGLSLKILSTQQEAQFIFQGVITDPFVLGDSLFIIDLGGGSAELIAGQGSTIQAQDSFKIGCVLLREKFISDYPISKEQRLALENFTEKQVMSFLKIYYNPLRQIILTGGIIFCLTQNLPFLQKNLFSISALAKRVNEIAQLSLPQIRKDPFLPSDRADLLPVGGIILLKILSLAIVETFSTSKRNLRYGLISGIFH